MRKLFTLFTMCMLAAFAWADDITFDPTVDTGDFPVGGDAKPYVVSKDGVTISVSSGMIAADKGVWAYRVYKNQTMTVTCDNSDITEIKFECAAEGEEKYGPGCFTASVPTYTYTGNVGTWSGTSRDIVFTASSNQVRATKITVTVGKAGLSSPQITPASGIYYDPVQVTITCPTDGAKIYYTTNGSTPTTSSTQYTAPFTVSSNKTIKAIAAKDGELSAVVTAEYVFASATTVQNISEFQQVDDNTVVKFANPVNVLAQNKSYLFVKDNTGYALFYGNCGQTYVNGDVIPAGFVGTKTTYNGEPELKDLVGFQPAEGNSPIAPFNVSADVVGHNRFGQYVRMENVTLMTEDEKNYTLVDEDGNTCAVYFGTMGVSAPSDLNVEYIIEGIIGSYGKDDVIYQLLPTMVKKVNPGCDGSLSSLGDLPDNQTVTMELDAIVLGQQGNYLYLKDDCGYGLAYGPCGQSYKPGDVIPAGYGGTKATYDMEPELKNLTGFKPASGNIGGVDQLEKDARVTRVPEIGHDIWGQYIKLENVFIDLDNKVLRDASGNEIGYYDRFGVNFPANTSKSYTVYGIVGSYKTVYQVLITRIDFKPEPIYVGNIEDLYELNQGVVGTFTTRLTAIYQNGLNLYVKDVDDNYSLVYGSVDYTKFVNGDYIEDAQASWTLYNGNKQLKPVAETFVKAGHGAAVQPEVLAVEELSQDMLHWYVRIDDAKIYKEGDNFIIDDGAQATLFNRFNIDIPENDQLHTVWGFVTVYDGKIELYPISIDKEPGTIKGDVNGDGEVTVADVNIIISVILGNKVSEAYMEPADVNMDNEYTVADVNECIKIILGWE